ncbi:protein SERAC1-like isoform X2 [Watersipora subatra]|uniref:protein SERAC1-like isoform X2 n=1 Tax=Watersipora subatra TaxID=2589382 RepID=UPI00355B39F4
MWPRSALYVQPIFSAASRETLNFNEDYNYINIPIWQRLRTKHGPKYWARIARTCGPAPRALAIEILSRYHDLPDGVIYGASLACDTSTLIELASKKGTDIRFFLSPRACYSSSEHLSGQIYRFLRSIPKDADENAKYLVDTLLGRKPVTLQETECEEEEDAIGFPEEINKPRRSDLSPTAQSLASLSMSALEVIKLFTRHAAQRQRFVYEDEGLQLLTRIWCVFKSNEEMMCKLADILVNLSVDKENHSVLVQGRFLHMLASWLTSLNKELSSKAASALSNLNGNSSQYKSGVYLLHPIPEDLSGAEVDVVFIHGVNGGVFYTWRQSQSMKDSDDYSTCWPMDWLADEFGSTIRAIGVDMCFNATQWGSVQPPSTLSIEEQAKRLADMLLSCQIGGEGRKVLWVGHSMGGIIIKHLLTLAEERLQYKSLLENTQGIVFIGVPHRGCPAATLTQRTSYIAYPSTQVQELANTAKMQDINSRFVSLIKEREIRCINFMEGCKTQVKANIGVHVVPPEYSELDVGENVLLPDDNHITICKPEHRGSRLFTALVDLLSNLVHH